MLRSKLPAQTPLFALVLLLVAASLAQDTNYPPEGQQIPSPLCLSVVHPWWGYDGKKPLHAGGHRCLAKRHQPLA